MIQNFIDYLLASKETLFDSKLILRLPNERLFKLVNKEWLKQAGYEILYKKQNRLSKSLHIEVFSCKDVMQILSKNTGHKLDNWRLFFEILLEEFNVSSSSEKYTIIEMMKNSPLFLLASKEQNKRVTIDNFQKKRYIAPPNFGNFWKDCILIELIYVQFEEERRLFELTEICEKKISYQQIIENILLDYQSSSFTPLQTWKDILFFATHQEDFSEALKETNFSAKDILRVPTKNSNFSKVDQVFLNTVIGTPVRVDKNCVSGFQEAEIEKSFSFLEILQIESFLLSHGCLKFSPDMLISENQTFSFSPYDSYEISQISIEILKHHNNIQAYFGKLQVSNSHNTNSQLSLLCLDSLLAPEDNFVPKISLPNVTTLLARDLGVATEKNCDFCLKVLYALSENKITDTNLYCTW